MWRSNSRSIRSDHMEPHMPNNSKSLSHNPHEQSADCWFPSRKQQSQTHRPLWGSRWGQSICPRGIHALVGDVDQEAHGGGVRFEKIMWSHVHVPLFVFVVLSWDPAFSSFSTNGPTPYTYSLCWRVEEKICLRLFRIEV